MLFLYGYNIPIKIDICKCFMIYFQIFTTFRYTSLKNSDLLISSYLIRSPDGVCPRPPLSSKSGTVRKTKKLLKRHRQTQQNMKKGLTGISVSPFFHISLNLIFLSLRSYFICHFSRLGIVQTSLALLSTYRKGWIILSCFSVQIPSKFQPLLRPVYLKPMLFRPTLQTLRDGSKAYLQHICA